MAVREQLLVAAKLLGLPYLVSVPIDSLFAGILLLAELLAVRSPWWALLTTDGLLDQPYPCKLFLL